MSTDNNTSNYRIPPLQGSDDYPSWKIYISDTLTDAGLDDHIDETFTLPADSAKLAEWNKADKRALSAIRLRVAPDIVHHVQGESTALGAWQTLASAFETTGLLGIVLARHRLYSTRAKDDEPLETHIKSMRRIQGELKSLGKPVDDADFAVALLGSLPPSWDSFVRATLASLTAPTTKGVLALITTEDRRLKQRQTETGEETPASAALVSRDTRPRPSPAGRNPSRAQHQAVSAPAKPASGRSIRCNICGQLGHFARGCATEDTGAHDRAYYAHMFCDHNLDEECPEHEDEVIYAAAAYTDEEVDEGFTFLI